jgi:hypothetical protein
MKNSILFLLSALAGAALVTAVMTTAAPAGETLMGNNAWGFSQQTSRASIASLMMQHENNNKAKDALGLGGGFACGGGGTATATANYTCIILNNSTAQIETDQDSEGDQDADATTEVTANGLSKKSLSSILESLQ